MKIYIVRHGETKGNVKASLNGWIDDPLNENGIKIAIQTGEGLKGIVFDACFSSPLSRAKKTAELILKESGNNCDVHYDDRLKELNVGDYEGESVESDAVKNYLKNPLQAPAFPNGESVKDVIIRTQEFLHEIVKLNYKCVLVSTHGCALRAMLNFLYEDKDNFWHTGVPLNCCINILESNDGKIKLIEEDVIYYDKSLCVDRFKMLTN